jgi:hypothetical protein
MGRVCLVRAAVIACFASFDGKRGDANLLIAIQLNHLAN